MDNRELYLCPLCNRYHIHDYMSQHHLLPKVGINKKEEPIVYICNTCHKVLHFCHTNEQLRTKYNSIDSIMLSKKVMMMVELYKYKADNCIFKLRKLKYKLKCA